MPVPGRRRLPRPLGRTGRQMAGVGVAGAVLLLLIAHTALVGLAQVDRAYAAVGQLATAERAFQHADMLHDALRGRRGDGDGAAVGVLAGHPHRARHRRPGLPGRPAGGGRGPAARRPGGGRCARCDPSRSGSPPRRGAWSRWATRRRSSAQYPAFKVLFDRLADEQAAVVARLSAAAEAKEETADRGQRTARRPPGRGRRGRAARASSASPWLLGRQGRRLAAAGRPRARASPRRCSTACCRTGCPTCPGSRLAARYVPCGTGVEVGGDWYDVLPLPGGEVGLVMGDVAGHDLGAAAVMGQLRNALRAYASEGLSPGAGARASSTRCATSSAPAP